VRRELSIAGNTSLRYSAR